MLPCLLAVKEPLNYGSQLLLPHVPRVLAYLQRRATAVCSSKKAMLNPRELNVLSRVSELVTDVVASLALLEIILPLCARKAQRGAGDATLVPLLTTAENLLRRVPAAEQYVTQVTPMFSSAAGRQSRQLLCAVLFLLLPKSQAKLVSDLNAWDARKVDEPHFERRISAFSAATKMEDVGLELGLLVIHNCFHALRTEKDISLRDCASHCLRVLCPRLARRYAAQPAVRTLVLERTVMEILRRGVRDKDEAVQHEMLGLLGEMTRKCGDLHPALRDLQVRLSCSQGLLRCPFYI